MLKKIGLMSALLLAAAWAYAADHQVYLALTIRDAAQAQAKVLAQPRVLAKLDETSTVRWTSGEEKMSLAIKPSKSQK